ncbi:MAG TPA: alpha/beta fold hydrolase [Rhizomicrobium sp.]|jgi:thioesterase domain-containing protein/acyl carrier protein|nr:alpha/beta fold hydrolase [Rhizomicrobium sp.]
MAPDTAARLTDIWCRALNVAAVAPDGDFFDLGGDSLMAVGLFLEIEHAFGVKLPITAIYDAPTVAAQLEMVAAEAAPAFSHFVQLRKGAEERPFFIVHGVGGTVIELAALGREIDAGRAVYAIQARGIDGSAKPLETMEGMAALYVEEIRRKQPQGPWAIGGYSFGGVVAMEMARLFGPENVAQLVMIDAYAHPNTWPLMTRLTVKARKLLSRLRHQSPGEIASALLRKSFGPKTDRAAYVNNWLGAIDPNLPLALRQARIAGDAALIAYTPRPYAGRATFIRAAKTGTVFPSDARNVWGKLIGRFELQSTPGDHRSILGAHVGELAARVSQCLTATPLSSPPERREAARGEGDSGRATSPVPTFAHARG